MNWRAKITLICLILTPIVIGVAVWLHFQNEARSPMQLLSAEFLREAPELGPGGHVLVPNLKKAKIIAPDRPHDPTEVHSDDRFAQIKRRRTFTVSTNSDGFRGPELTEKNGFRILCIGESVTFGWGVKHEETYPSRLSQILGVEVINAGVPAMRPQHMANWLKNNASKYKPDLVLFTARPYWGHPNTWDNYIGAIRSAQQAVMPSKVGLILPPISAFDPRGLKNLPIETQKLAAHLPNLPTLDLTPIFQSSKGNDGVTLTIDKGIQVMTDLATGKIIAKGPSPPMTPGAPSLAPEITAAFEADSSLREPLMFDGAHPDVVGFELFANEVAKWLVNKGLYKGP